MHKPDLARWRLADFVRELAAGTPLPGGGCAVAVAGALAAALGALAAKITARRQPGDQEGGGPELLDQLESAQTALLELADEDAMAYQEVVQALRLPRTTGAEQERRRQSVQQAFLTASGPPLALARWGSKLLEWALILVRQGDRVILADVGVMGYLAQAVIQGGLVNVAANLRMVPPQDPRAQTLQREAESLAETLAADGPLFQQLLQQRLQEKG